MQTRCPHCQTTFRVSEAQLNAAKGKVRCGKCQQVFNAREHIHLATEPSVETSTAAPAVVKKSPPPAPAPPPQIDWLNHNDKDNFDHIDLGHPEAETAPTAGIETTENVPEFSADQFEAKRFATDIDEHEFISIEVPDDVDEHQPEETIEDANPDTDHEFVSFEVPDDVSSHQAEDSTEDSASDTHDNDEPFEMEMADEGHFDDDVTDDHHLANVAPLIPSGLNESLLNVEEGQPLPGIGPAYEDDTRLNYREEQGLGDLQEEIQRQLQSPAEDDDEEDAFDSVLGYIEDIEDVKKQSTKTSPIENIQLNAIPDPEDSNTVNWDDAVHHDPEVPASLRSSMQALQKKKRLPLLTAFMAAVLFVLIADLGLQAIVFRSYDIATQWPQTRSILTSVCNYLPCVYSGRREPRKIQLVNRDVRVHPAAKHALLISATVVNQSKYAQPYPRLAIKLSDLSGDVVAEREFAPKEYLKASESRLKLLRPNVPTLITLEVLDPGSEAVNFEFRFL